MEETVTLGLGGGVSLVLCGWLIRFVVTTAAAGGLSQGSAVGIRTHATRSSEAAWAAGHRAAEPWTRRVSWWAVVVGTVLTAGGLAAASGLEQVRGPVMGVLFGLGFGGLLLGLVPITRAANRGAREADAEVGPAS